MNQRNWDPIFWVLREKKKQRAWILGCKGRGLETWSPKTERQGLIARKPGSLRNEGMGPE